MTADFRKVVAEGDPLINIPEHNANVLLFKDFDVSGRQLTFGAGVQYVSERLGETGTTFFLPSYTLAKLLASYEVIDNLTIHGEVTNLTDEEYYPASYSSLWIAAGAPLQYQVRAIYDF
jgi:iron complex outermembrane receptor protein